MGYVFISYSSNNRQQADALRERFLRENISVWMAPNDIPAGSHYAGTINRALKDCACLALLLTEDAQNSVWVAKEVERAVNYRKPIVSVQLEPLTLNDDFAFYLSTDQIVTVTDPGASSPAMQKVLAAVAAFTGSDRVEVPVAPPPAPPPPAVPKRPRRLSRGQLWGLIAAGVILLGVGVFLVGWLSGNINW